MAFPRSTRQGAIGVRRARQGVKRGLTDRRRRCKIASVSPSHLAIEGLRMAAYVTQWDFLCSAHFSLDKRDDIG